MTCINPWVKLLEGEPPEKRVRLEKADKKEELSALESRLRKVISQIDVLRMEKLTLEEKISQLNGSEEELYG